MNLPPHLMNLQANLNNLLKTTLTSNPLTSFPTIESKLHETKHPSKQKEKKKSKKSKVDSEGKSNKIKNPKFQKKRWKVLRKSAGEVWEDPTLEEWPENDYRIFCGDLGNEVSDDILTNAFRKYSSFIKARVIRDKRTCKSRGYGFVSFGDANDYIKAMRELNGKYVGNRPIRLQRSTWKDRCLFNSKSKLENVKFIRNKTKIRHRDLIYANNLNNNARNSDGGMNANNHPTYDNQNMNNIDMINPYNPQIMNPNMTQYNMQSNTMSFLHTNQNMNNFR
jgi:RNA recognition motif-containing protein